ncbi:MAG: hypothetical protein ACRC7S_14740 [Cetobacterium sp.]
MKIEEVKSTLIVAANLLYGIVDNEEGAEILTKILEAIESDKILKNKILNVINCDK